MTINKVLENNKITLTLEGRLDTITSPQLQEALIPAFNEANEIVLDFAKLAYVSSAGLRVLLMGEKTSKSANVPMSIKNVSEEIMEVLDMTGFTDMLTIM